MYCLVNVFPHPVGLNMGGTIVQEELFVLLSGRFSERILCHVQRIRLCTSNHQQWFIDETDMIAHQIQQVACSVLTH